MKKLIHNQEGFSLIEALIAIIILGIGILTVTTMQVTGMQGNAKARNITTSSNWASDRIEYLLSKPYDDDDLKDDDDDKAAGLDDDTAATADGMATSPDGFHTIYWNIHDNYDLTDPKTDTKTIRIIVQRKDRGETREITFNYLKARDFLN